jgi:hypothetical protein
MTLIKPTPQIAPQVYLSIAKLSMAQTQQPQIQPYKATQQRLQTQPQPNPSLKHQKSTVTKSP